MTKTFRFRLTAWYGVFFALLLVSFSALCYHLLARSLAARIDAQLTSEAETAAYLLGDEIQEARGDVAKGAAEVVEEMRLNGNSIAVLRDGRPIAGSVLPRSRSVSRRSPEGLTVVSTAPAESLDGSLRTLREVMFGAVPVFLLLAAGGGYLLARRNLAPLETMAAQASRIADTRARLALGDAAEEVSTLAAAFNELLARLDESFDTMRRFVADASHELRTPLSVIRGEADLALARERDPGAYRESLAVILDESRRLSRLVDDLLNLARTDAGAVRLRVTEFYFDEMLAECCRSAQRFADSRGLTLECRTPADIPFTGDEELLRRLTANLLDNAIRYTPAGGRVTASVERDPGGVRLRIADTGIGIPPDAAPHVFERFFRADKARSRAEGGFGLGLSIVKWIAESHHGAVEVESRPNAGATFTVTLPQ